MQLKIQRQERAKRDRNRLKMRGLLTPPGRKPRAHEVMGDPVFKPGPGPRISSFDWSGLAAILPFFLRRRKGRKDIE